MKKVFVSAVVARVKGEIISVEVIQDDTCPVTLYYPCDHVSRTDIQHEITLLKNANAPYKAEKLAMDYLTEKYFSIRHEAKYLRSIGDVEVKIETKEIAWD